jgi:hypothetical protein
VELRRTRWLRAAVFCFVAIVSAIGSFTVVAGAQTPTPTPRNVSIFPAVANISWPTPGATVSVLIDNATGVGGYTVAVAYDNETAVQATGISTTGTLSEGSGCFFESNTESRTCVGGSEAGQICPKPTGTSDCPGGTCRASAIGSWFCETPLGGSGTLFNITFQGLANGTSNVTISDCLLGVGSESVPCNLVGGQIVVSGYPPPATALVCDVAPSTGSDFGQFGDGQIKNNDVTAIFAASLLTPPPAGSALFSAMDSVAVDTPPVCGGDKQIRNNDVVACFQRALLGGPNFTRTYTGGTSGTCTSAQQ